MSEQHAQEEQKRADEARVALAGERWRTRSRHVKLYRRVLPIVILTLADGLDANDTVARLKAGGVLVSAFYGGRIRAVTHYGITAVDIEAALRAFRDALTPVRI